MDPDPDDRRVVDRFRPASIRELVAPRDREGMMWPRLWSWGRENRLTAAAFAVLLLAALGSAYGAWTFRSEALAAKKAEHEKAEQLKALAQEGEAKEKAFREALAATEPALNNALQGVRTARAGLAQAEAARRELWIPPAVDNGELVARFNKAVEGLR